MKTVLVLVIVMSVLLMFATIVNAQDNTTYNATAIINNSNGSTIGLATFIQDANSTVHINVTVSGLKPGLHGIHIHDKGFCIAPSFKSAGEHYNPLGKDHGLLNPKGPHAGDLPNLEVGVDGKGYMNVTTKLVMLSPGPTTLFTANGTSLVIHSNPDDLITNPAGNSGERIACGAIKK